jgi:hypothetical protein
MAAQVASAAAGSAAMAAPDPQGALAPHHSAERSREATAAGAEAGTVARCRSTEARATLAGAEFQVTQATARARLEARCFLHRMAHSAVEAASGRAAVAVAAGRPTSSAS